MMDIFYAVALAVELRDISFCIYCKISTCHVLRFWMVGLIVDFTVF